MHKNKNNNLKYYIMKNLIFSAAFICFLLFSFTSTAQVRINKAGKQSIKSPAKTKVNRGAVQTNPRSGAVQTRPRSGAVQTRPRSGAVQTQPRAGAVQTQPRAGATHAHPQHGAHVNRGHLVKRRMLRPKNYIPRPVNARPGYVWIEGYWKWSAFYGTYIWVDGMWETDRPGYVWVPGYWESTPYGYFWIEGYWQARTRTVGDVVDDLLGF